MKVRSANTKKNKFSADKGALGKDSTLTSVPAKCGL